MVIQKIKFIFYARVYPRHFYTSFKYRNNHMFISLLFQCSDNIINYFVSSSPAALRGFCPV